MNDLNWDNVLLELKNHLDDDSFEGWIKHLCYKSNNGYIAYLTAPSQFIKNWITGNYKEQILEAIKLQLPKITSLDITISTVNDFPASYESVNNNQNTNTIAASETKNFNTLGFKLDPNYTFENFVVGKPNEFAYAAAKRIAEDTNVTFNPLFIYGGVGLGKTHLMHSIAWHIIKSKQPRKFLYLSAEKFMQLYIKALRDKDIISFKEMFRSTDVLMIDDFQFISGKDQTQEEFFHSFNSLIEQSKQIILSADKSPSELSKIESRIMSRLNAGLVADIHATSYELRIGILETKTKQLKIKLPEDVIKFLASSITSNVRELEGALKRIIAKHELLHKKIDLEMAMNAVEDIIKTNNKTITIDEIQKTVSEHFAVKFSDLLSNKRLKDIAHARQIGMYLAKKLTSMSFAEIGKKFGGKDHTTVLYAVNKIEELRKTDSETIKNINLLNKIIKKV
ncbi:chromosomal replication initiator protein DnaA [Rickettsiales bacterium LUAb2]